MYSFGDSTAFPIRGNFLDTLTRTVRACSALFTLECELEESQDQVHEIHKAVTAELSRHESLEVALNLAIGQVPGSASMQTADLLRRTHLSILQKARQALLNERERLVAQATPKNMAARVKEVLSALWLDVELPHTQWSYRWRIDDTDTAKTQLHAQIRGLTASFFAAPPKDSLWSGEIPVSSLLRSLQVKTPVWSRRSKGTQTKQVELADYSIIEIESALSRQRLVLRRGGKAKHALLITLADAAQSHPTISLVDEQQGALGEQHELSLPETEELYKLWALIQEHQAELVSSRSGLSNLCIDNRQVETFDHPSEVAETLLGCIAPLAREIRLRSRVPGELILKRSTGEGRREELFLPRDTLQALYKDLPERFRRVFDAMGLGQESTRELVTMLCDSKPGRQRSARVVSSTSDALPPERISAADRAMERAIDELTASVDETLDIEESTFNQPSVIIGIDAA